MENQVVVINVNELKSIITESVSNAMSKISPPKEEDVLLKRKDVATLFSVSLVTIADWMNTGKLPYHRINSRIFFKKSEVLEALQSKKKLKSNTK